MNVFVTTLKHPKYAIRVLSQHVHRHAKVETQQQASEKSFWWWDLWNWFEIWFLILKYNNSETIADELDLQW